MAFEVYKPRGDKKEKDAIVSFSKTSIVFNNIVREKLASKRIELAYDQDKNVLRIRPAENGSGMEIKKTKIFGKGFFNHFNIKKRGKFAAEYNESENAFYVQL